MPIFDPSPDFLQPRRKPEREEPPDEEPRWIEVGSVVPSQRTEQQRFRRERDTLNYDSTRDRDLIVDRLLNESGEAEGPNVAPEVRRGIRVMPPTQFRIVHQVESKYCTRFILSWLERPEMALWQPQYAIYTYAQQTVVRWHGQNLDSPIWDGPLQDPVLATASPCEVVVWGYLRQPVVFSLQTRLSNGLVSSLDAMPTCAAKCDPYWRKKKKITATYTCTLEDEMIRVDASGGAVTVTLFDCRQLPDGRVYTVKKLDASANAVTVQGAVTGQNIDGAATYVITTQYQSNDFENDRATATWDVV